MDRHPGASDCFRFATTVGDMDVADEPTWTYSRRVVANQEGSRDHLVWSRFHQLRSLMLLG